jgi:carboxymethylenebutenolidase
MAMRFVSGLLLVLALGCSSATPSRPLPEPEAWVDWSNSRGTGRGLLVVPQGAGPFPALLLLHGNFGLDEGMQANARRLAGKGYLVLAVDLYRGKKPGDVLEAHILNRALPEGRVRADITSAIDLLLARAETKQGALGVIGWQMGGGYALDAAIADPRLGAVVTCYGRLTTDPALLANMKASVAAVFAGKDQGNSPETIEAFRQAMEKAGKKVAGLKVFEECDYGFMNPRPGAGGDDPSGARSAATAQAWQFIDDYLAAELRLP